MRVGTNNCPMIESENHRGVYDIVFSEALIPLERFLISCAGEFVLEPVTLEPAGQAIEFEYRNKQIHLTVPKLEINSVIVVK